MEVFNYFPTSIKDKLQQEIEKNQESFLEEIRIRVNRPILMKWNNNSSFINYVVSSEDILQIMEKITENSVYSYQKQICNGYITLKGGHRVGICGNVVIENHQVININYIYSLNFRIARQIIGVAETIKKEVYDGNRIYTTLIVSPPGAGKTTLLRDLIRCLSMEKTIGVVDERGEISAMYKNVPQNDLGLKVDILNNIEKPLGLTMLVRSMSPEIVCADEIGTKEDIQAIRYAITSGVKGIFTAHGDSLESIKQSPILSDLITLKMIDKVILLDKQDRNNIQIYDFSSKRKEETYILL